jgi:G:T/U-mismatch repair DNA glycosylase
MRITIGNYKGLSAEELVEQDPDYAEWFWRHAEQAELRQEVRAALAESRLWRLSDQYDRLLAQVEGLKRQRAEERMPSAEEINFEKLRADRLQGELAEAYRMLAEKEDQLAALKEVFKKLRAEYARMVCPSGSSS